MSTPDRPPVTDDARAEMRRVLEDQFWPFLASDPHDPERFWSMAVDAVLAAGRARSGLHDDRQAEFDRWLNQERAQAWTQGLLHAETCEGGLECDPRAANPYRQAT